ncbi:hypothetical protein FH039_09210 [Thermococcus indicus]|uniref:Uncharacterized protein n=1 Tax=Thermococcus indicus TaxID=2586643 RepID=A0A4Y5SLG2_9EURY|nr:hypothetical protein [Thermococcus indicus]QDA31743.1 hypothetical protein FH039_09210 [Thermococcus indicus]
MADISTRGFAIIALSILTLVYPVGWFFALMTVLIFSAVGWTILGIADELGGLNSEIRELRREIKALERKVDGMG